MVDTQFAPLHDKISAAIKAISPLPIKYIVNTHFHGDHTGGNELFQKEGAVVVAQDNIRVRLAAGTTNGTSGQKTAPAQPGALPKMPESVFETALFDSGRPVLVVPPGFTGMVGKRILFAWNGSTESARAISLAMPVLSGAEAIEVLSVEGAMVPGPTALEIAESLKSHGLNVTGQHVKPGAKSAGQTIVDRAQALGADLIVKGAYTQSRLRQMIFGGVTRDLILTSPIPVLFSY